MKNNQNPEQTEQAREQIIELGSDVTSSQNGRIYTLTIIGQVEGHQVLPENCKTTKYEHVLPLLAGIEESEDIGGISKTVKYNGNRMDIGGHRFFSKDARVME